MFINSSVSVEPEPADMTDVHPWLRLRNRLLLLQLNLGGYVRKPMLWIIKEYKKVFQKGHYLRLLIAKNKKLLRKVKRKWRKTPFVAWFVEENRKVLLNLTRWGFRSNGGYFRTPQHIRRRAENRRSRWQSGHLEDLGYETEDDLDQSWRTLADNLEEARRIGPREILMRVLWGDSITVDEMIILLKICIVICMSDFHKLSFLYFCLNMFALYTFFWFFPTFRFIN